MRFSRILRDVLLCEKLSLMMSSICKAMILCHHKGKIWACNIVGFMFSFFCRFARVGSVVLAIHDASDIFLEIGKMSKYSGAEALASFSFILFVLSWIILRLIYYPFWVLWSTR